MKKILNAKIISNKKVSGEYRKIVLNSPSIAKTAVPGQFVTLKLGSGNVPFLRRPMSIHKIKPPVIELLYKVRGVGTELLAKYNEKDTLEILGPLGNGFKTDGSFSTAILVGGGYGIAPLLALHDRLKKLDKKIITIIGAKSKKLVNKEGFTGALIATEDGSDGIKGLVTKILSSTCCNLSTDSVIFACGPDKMLKAVSEAGRLHNIPCQISMENLMACGVGVCLSCVCAVKQGLKTENKRVCVDGPVFDAEEIIWQI